jgi:hypothetical protein
MKTSDGGTDSIKGIMDTKDVRLQLAGKAVYMGI